MIPSGNPASQNDVEIGHCVVKIRQIISENGDDRRALLQLGYNLGRLSELTGLGREPFWDAWKDAVASWDRNHLESLVRDLPIGTGGRSPDDGETPARAETDAS